MVQGSRVGNLLPLSFLLLLLLFTLLLLVFYERVNCQGLGKVSPSVLRYPFPSFLLIFLKFLLSLLDVGARPYCGKGSISQQAALLVLYSRDKDQT